MPVFEKVKLAKLTEELQTRFTSLSEAITARPLKSSTEGLRRGCWVHPELKVATKASSMDLRLKAEDFKTILAEIKKLK